MKFSKPTFSRYRRVALIVFLIGPLLGCIGGIVMNRWYWGHWFDRPGITQFVRDAAHVKHARELKISGIFNAIVIDSQAPVSAVAARVAKGLADREYPHYFLEERALQALLPVIDGSATLPRMPDERLASIIDDMGKRSLLTQPSPGYSAFDSRGRALLVEFADREGRQYVFAGVRQGELSNDHLAFHEIVFAVNADGGIDRVVSHRHFFFDIAGMEGMPWWAWVFMLTAPLTGMSTAIACAVLARGFAISRRPKRGECIKCRYDLGATQSGICPECGERNVST